MFAEQRKLTADETKEEVLQAYFDRLSILLIDRNLLAIPAKVNSTDIEGIQAQSQVTGTVEDQELLDSAMNVIRARTLSILRRFENDTERKTSVIRFLIEADIIGQLKLNLDGADLSEVDLREVNLSKTDLGGVNLSKADLIGADLSGANLLKANLSGANLNSANLSKADLIGTNLSGANLFNADLSEAELFGADLSEAFRGHAEIRVKTCQ